MTDLHSNPGGDRDKERGAALVLAIFALVMLAGTGIALLAISGGELMMSRASLQNERAFFVAEAGLESGRAALVLPDGSSDPGASLAAAAGLDGRFDFAPEKIRAIHDAAGRTIGFEGYGDDVPLIAPTELDGSLYTAFLTNDPQEAAGDTPLVDGDGRLVVFGVGIAATGSLEVVKGIVEPRPLLPSMPPCTIMMLGPSPDFYPGSGDCSSLPDDEDEDTDDEAVDEDTDGGAAEPVGDVLDDENEDEDEDTDERLANKTFWGTDCAGHGGEPDHYVPVICVQGCGPSGGPDEDEDEDLDLPTDLVDDEDEDEDASGPECADTVVEMAIEQDCPNDFVSGPYRGADTIANMNDPSIEPTMGPGYEIDPGWTDCGALQAMLANARELADHVCVGNDCSMSGAGWNDGTRPVTTPSSITFVDGDLDVGAGYWGRGLLFVTGTLRFDATASWDGAMLVVGKGRFIRTGFAGAGLLSGAAVVVNIAGEDGEPGTADDCRDGFGVATYHEAEQQTGDTQYCTDDLEAADPLITYGVTQFRQY